MFGTSKVHCNEFGYLAHLHIYDSGFLLVYEVKPKVVVNNNMSCFASWDQNNWPENSGSGKWAARKMNIKKLNLSGGTWEVGNVIGLERKEKKKDKFRKITKKIQAAREK